MSDAGAASNTDNESAGRLNQILCLIDRATHDIAGCRADSCADAKPLADLRELAAFHLEFQQAA